MYHWVDGTVGYFLKYQYFPVPTVCAAMQRAGGVLFRDCDYQRLEGAALCEKGEPSSETYVSQNDAPVRSRVQLLVPSNSTVRLAQTICPSKHWTHEFLACDAQSACWQQDSFWQRSASKTRRNMTSSCQFPFSEMFECTHSAGRVPYSLVCDHRQDCPDNSDEDFCVHPSCTSAWQFECSNKQVRWECFCCC